MRGNVGNIQAQRSSGDEEGEEDVKVKVKVGQCSGFDTAEARRSWVSSSR